MLITMEDHIARAEKFKKKAKKLRLRGWGLFGSKHHDIAQLLDDAAVSYKLARNWDNAKRMYIKLADHHLKIKTKHDDAAAAVVEAAHCYDITSDDEAISCLKEGADYLLGTGKFDTAATYYKAADLYKEIAEIYESKEEIGNAIEFYEKASELFQKGGSSNYVNQCYEKAAQLAAQIEKYAKAIEMYEKLVNYLLGHCEFLKHKVVGHLFNAGICKLCRGDNDVAMAEQYADLYPTFGNTWQCKSLENIAVSVANRDLTKFNKAVENDMTPLDSWANYLLSRVKDQLKASMSRRTRRQTTFGDGGKQREMPTGLERSRTTTGGVSTETEECKSYFEAPLVERDDAAKFSDSVKASRPSWTTRVLSRVRRNPEPPSR